MNDARGVRLLTVTLAVMLGALATHRAVRIYIDVSSPIELTFPNSVSAYLAREFQQGRPIYRDFREPPHVLALYGPLLYAVPGTLGAWIDADAEGLFAIGRSVSLLATLGTALMIIVLVRRDGATSDDGPSPGPWIIATLSGLMFLTAAIQWPVLMCFRADPAETFFVFTGLALTSRARGDLSRFAGLGLFFVAFLFKQSALVAPAAVALSLILSGQRTAAIRYAFIAAAAFGGLILALNVFTGGMFSLNTMHALRANITPSNLVTVAAESALGRCLVPFALAAAVLIWIGPRQKRGVFSIFLIISFVFATLTTIRDGSADNYFLPSLAVACVIVGRAWVHGLRTVLNPDRHVSPQPASPTLITSLMVAGLFFAPPLGRAVMETPALMGDLRGRAERDAAQRAFIHQAAAELDALNGPVLCQYDPVNLFCRNTIMMDTLTFTGLADQGVFDDTQLIDLILTRRLAAAVLLFPLEGDDIPRYQSTAWVRESWLRALWEAGYRGERMKPLFVYTPPSANPP